MIFNKMLTKWTDMYTLGSLSISFEAVGVEMGGHFWTCYCRPAWLFLLATLENNM